MEGRHWGRRRRGLSCLWLSEYLLTLLEGSGPGADVGSCWRPWGGSAPRLSASGDDRQPLVCLGLWTHHSDLNLRLTGQLGCMSRVKMSSSPYKDNSHRN